MVKPKREVVRRTIELPPELEESVRRLAEANTRSVNQEIVHALKEHLRREARRQEEESGG